MPRKWTNNPKGRYSQILEPQNTSVPDSPETLARRLVEKGLASPLILDSKHGRAPMDGNGGL